MVSSIQNIHKPKSIQQNLIRGCHHKAFLLITILLILFYTCVGYKGNKEFDYLIFTQRWLPSSCIAYKETSKNSLHSCVLPDNYDFWAIHGLWPTKAGSMGPFFCNNSMKFDINALEPIRSDLENYWPNIESGKSIESLWAHEWTKHGTCVMQLKSLNAEFKYFNVTLGFFKQFNINELFNKYHILPSDAVGFDVINLFNIVKNSFGKNPHLNCIIQTKTKQAFLNEIRICFSKDLELIDCEHIDKINQIYKPETNCPENSPILLPKTTEWMTHTENLKLEKEKKMKMYNTLMEVLNVIKFLQWGYL